ncbi:MAG: substrate-binding domain-containing protein [Spirochaetaceae bacterium]
MKIKSGHNRSRYRFAYITTFFEGDEYNRQIWESIEKECIKNDIDLIMFSGKNLQDIKTHKIIFNELFKFINPKIFDGIILSSSSICSYVGQEYYLQKLKKIIDNNIVSISLPLENKPSIIIDNEYGMKIMIDHLVEVHNLKKFLYVSGPKKNPESIIRLNSVQKNLKKHNIILNREDILYGDFTPDSVIPVLEPLLKKGLLKWDVIVCANDCMASKSIDLLKRYGYSVPNDMAVTGFDNSSLAKNQHPRITTIDQSLDKIDASTVQLLLSILEGRECNTKKILMPELVINESCGCFSYNNKKIDTNYIKKIDDDRMMEIFNNNIFYPKSDSFIKEVQKIIYTCSDDSSLLAFEDYVLTLLKNMKIENQELLWDIINKLITLFNDVKISRVLHDQITYRENIVETRLKNERVLTSEDLPNLYQNIDHLFADNGINSYYIVLYDEFHSENRLKLVHGFKEGKAIKYKKGKDSIFVDKFVPEEYLPQKRSTLISFPLFSVSRFFGYIVLDSNNYNNTFYESIQTNINSALMNILYLNQLEETQKLLVESKKIEFLGSLVSGLAHEINTPVGIILTATSFLKDKIKKLNEIYKSGKLNKIDIEDFFNESNQILPLVDNNLANTINLIQRFKKITLSADIYTKTSFNLIEQINTIILRKKSDLDKSNVKVIVESLDEINIKSYAIIFDQIFSELLENSLIYGFSDSNDGVIHITAFKKKGNINIIFEDNGILCSKKLLSNIFNPFYTTNRGQGYTGLGLTIAYNLVRVNLNGTMECHLGKPKGLIFKITFPY